MRVLRFILKWWRESYRRSKTQPTGIDSHKWESKIEIYRSLKNN